MASNKGNATGDSRHKARRDNDRILSADSEILKAILSVTGALILVLNKDGDILVFNKACENVTGYKAAEAVGRKLWEITNPPSHADQIRKFYQSLIREQFPETHERCWYDRQGNKHLIKWSNAALRDSNGELKYVVATGFDITESRAIRAELLDRTAELTERVKELRCLYGISRLSEHGDLHVEEFLQQVLELIPPAWQYPEICSARIRVGSTVIATSNFSDSNICQLAPINIDGQKIGDIQVCYTSSPEGESNPFLDEEASLLANICNAVGQAVGEYRARRRISVYQQRLRSLASELALTGERERRQVAQQLHNEIGHKLASLKYKLTDARVNLSESEQRNLLQLVESTIESTRNLTFELSPPVLHELGLGAALEWLAHQLETNYGIHCEFSDDRNPKPLSDDLRVELFQAVKELLVNIGKHSKASKAELSVCAQDGNLRITVGDDGIGFDTKQLYRGADNQLGWGLFGMRERLAHLGAEVAIESAPAQGTIARISVVLTEEPTPRHRQEQHTIDPTALTDKRSQPIRIILADDQQLTRAGLCALLQQVPDLEVVAEAVDGEEAVALAAKLKPDVILMDIAMPKLNGIEATERVLKENPNIKVIGLSMHADGQYVVEMLRAGATGYLLKDCAQSDLAQAIRIVQADLTFLSPGLARGVAINFVEGKPQPIRPEENTGELLGTLTPREIEILTEIAHGKSTKEIALHLSISVKTVETHRQHIMDKLDIRTIVDLTKFAIRSNLISLDQ